MTHPRTVIRNALYAQLNENQALIDLVDDKVFRHMVRPLKKAELPGVAFFFTKEQIEEESIDTSPRELTRMQDIQIEAMVNSEQVADDLDELCEAVENAIATDYTIAGTVNDFQMKSTEIAYLTEGHEVIGQAVMTYTAVYTQMIVETPIDDFDEVGTDFNLEAEQAAADQLHDELTGLSTIPEE